MSRTPASDQAKTLLLGYVRRMRALRDQRREISADIAEVRKEAKNAGFDAKRVEMVVRWQEDVDDKGRELVDEGEALYDLYRSVVDGEGQDLDAIMGDARDRALLKIFAPTADAGEIKGPTRKQKAVADALAAAACSKAMRGGG